MESITLALAKGRTSEKSIALLQNAGFHFDDFHDQTRKLVFYDTEQQIKLISVKALDVPTYVENGAADVGIVGKDNILESQSSVYELLDLKFGKCKLVVAGLTEQKLNTKTKLTVASKYPSVAKIHFESKGIPIETIKLNGSVELAPLIGMADFIVDIVETGRTLRENGLSVIEEIEDVSTRLIVNKASFATKSALLEPFISKIKNALE
ncbi:ATP phosphoribosyltransferase [Ornithinibacillus halophilus]|uniref:ATP phosphoribosyltransferase n=1 Tax=Ornithinibacillus halophilus TaxID=930117 RepID=A0A1M5H087_9BACI|nr:ATP phosphoribosyltransferase [Ornithinibacillus halophilus]SHG09403.1 ATP phosphoribosyltransferase catalytic subunit [Ornithinibacillus halophilus]